MRKISRLLAVAAVICLLAGCSGTKDVAYFQNAESVDLSASKMLYDARIMPKHVLTITESTTDDGGESAIPFKLGGLSKSEAEKLICEKIMPYMQKDADKPIVTVRMSNYKIAVLGEVTNPGMYTVANEKITILEALAKAGDLTIYGVRNNVQLIREDADGKKSIHILNLNDANLINSPYYYLQQNDIIYVVPNKVKAQNSSVGSMTTLWFSATSILISLTTLLYNVLK